MASILFAAACGGEVPIGEPGPPGEQGPPGEGVAGTPSVSAVIPGRVFLGRDNFITISGFGTDWTDSTSVEFGAGISVTGLNVASPTALVVEVATAQSAELGTRDVTVTDGEDNLSYLSAFTVSAPLDVTSTLGTVAQGSVIQIHAEQRDVSTPFDPTEDANGFTNLTVFNGNVPGIVVSASPFSVDALLLIDVMTPAGAATVSAQSGAITSAHPDAVNVVARAPEVLAANTITAGNVAQPLDTNLYEISIPANDVGFVDVTSANPAAAPSFIVLDSSGSFANIVSIGANWFRKAGAAAETYYIVYWDQSGAAGYNYDIDYSTETSDETEPNDTCATAQVVAALPANLANLTLSSGSDEDWFEITIAASDVGFPIEINTTAGEPTTDTYIEVFEADCTTPFGGPSSDVNYHEDHTTPVLTAAGTYYIKVSNSPAFPYAGALYNMSIKVPQPLPEMEPNDDSTMANAATVDGMTAAIGVAGDNDWFAVTLAAGDTLTATVVDGAVDTCGATATSIDTEIELYDSAAMSVAANDDIDVFTNYCSAASHTATTAGTYYIRVAGSAAFCSMCTFDYGLTIEIQ